MKPLSPKLSAFLAGVLLIPAGLQAAPLAYEGFDYPAGLDNLTNQIGGYGWDGVWQTVNNGSADLITGSLAAGAGAPSGYDALSTGNSTLLPNNRRVGRKIDTSASGPFGLAGYRDANGRIGADGKTIYVSFTQQPNGTALYYEFEFHRANLGDPGRIAGIGNDQGGDNVHLRAPNNTHTLIGPGNTNVNFYVVRIDFKAGNDDVFVYRNPTSLTEPGVPTLTRLGAADMSFDGISFGAFVGGGRTVSHDEVRLGETWADVTVLPATQPTFATQPHPTTSFAGGTIVLSARATGQPLPGYQWYKGSNPIPGETGASLTLSNVQTSDGGSYHVVATNSQGSATSSSAQVNVLTAPAGLLAYEGFDYAAGAGNLPGKSGGLGWGAAWTNVNGAGGTTSAGNLTAGTNAPNGFDAQSLGNSAFMPNAQRDGRLLDTSPGGRLGSAGYIDGSGNVGADGKTIYLSFLQQPDGTTKFYEFEFHRGDLGDPGRIGGIGNDTNNPTVALRTGGLQTLIGPGSTGVNLYVVRIDFKPGNDDVYVYQNPISATEPANPTLTMLSASDMSFNGLSIAAFDNGRTVKHDEIRVGQNWSDVIFGTSRRELVWVGDGVSNTWNFSAPNWNAGGGATAFVDGDPVTFDDSGSNTPAIDVPVNVSTSHITVANDTKGYTIGGAGSVISSGGLLKSGPAALTLSGTTSFGSAISMQDGSLTLSGTSSVGGELNIDFGDVTLSGTNSFTGILSSGGGGTVVLSGTNSFAGLASTSTNFTVTGATTITGTGGTAVWIGNLDGADSTLTIEAGGSLTMSGSFNDAWVIGRDGGSGRVVQNGGTITYNPTDRDVAFIGASANSSATVASYDMNGGTLEMTGKRLGLSIGPITSTLNQNGGTINIRQLDLGANLPTGTGIYNLDGGVINIGAGGITSNSGLYQANLGNGTVGATENWGSPLLLNLTGTTTFDTGASKVTLSGGIDGPGNLVKTGSGTLILSGFNTYSGTTTVNAGTIGGLGTSDQSDLTVASGASLAPGNDDVAAFFSGGSVTLASGSTLAIDIDSTSGFSDQLTTTGPLGISGATLSLAEIGFGIIPAGTELVIIDNTGTTRTGTFAGLAEGASITAGANSFTISYANASQVVLTSTTVETPYQAWASGMGLDGSPGKEAGFENDPEQDGISNGLEWVLGGDPLLADGGTLVESSASAANGLTLGFTREEASLGNVTLTLEWDTDLGGTWTSVPITLAGGAQANGVTVDVNQAGTPDEVSVNIPASNAVNGHLFARLRATMP